MKHQGEFVISKGITLRGLELFAIAARTGSVAQTARASGLSLAAVSQQLRNLDEALGQPLLDHTRRPMQLTPAGRLFLGRVDAALAQIRQAETEARTIDLSRITELRIGIIDDFDADVTPEFVSHLARQLQGCGFRLSTGLSHEIAVMLTDGELDIGILSSPDGGLPGLVEHPILRDPLIVALPAGTDWAPGSQPMAVPTLPFLRYDREQVLGRLIESVIETRGLPLDRRFELSSNPALLSLVASGAGWAITTALSALRARQLGWALTLAPLPAPTVSRTISLFCEDGRIGPEAADLAATFRRLLRVGTIEPARSAMPWLDGTLSVLDARP